MILSVSVKWGRFPRRTFGPPEPSAVRRRRKAESRPLGVVQNTSAYFERCAKSNQVARNEPGLTAHLPYVGGIAQ
jgi:hypothetical protein